MAGLRFSIRVRPGASRTKVGGDYAGALVVAVHSRAVDGQANQAALKALAAAFGVRAAQVGIVTGAQSRTKIVSIEGESGSLAARLAELLAVS
jgi:uncharacterized protein (TIGR00251 family)